MDNIDYKNLATKDDVKAIRAEMATKDDLSKVFSYLDANAEKNKKELKEEITEGFDRVMNILDKQSVILDRLDTELAAHTVISKEHKETLVQHEEVLDDHENRISVLELQPA